jgi:PAS domain S-box-containing protein
MPWGKDFQKKLATLRKRALSRMSEDTEPLDKQVDVKTRRLLQELNVHQIELELQNEELREAQQQLELSRDRYMQLYHHAPVGYVAVDSAGLVLQANGTLGRMLDRDIAKWVGKPLADLIHPDDREIFFGRFRAFFSSPSGKNLEFRMLKNDGATVYTKLEGSRIDPSVVPAAPPELTDSLLIIISDISRRKAAEQAIIVAKRQWEQTFDAVSDPIVIVNDKFRIVRVNMALAQRIGATPQDCVGKKCFEVLHARGEPDQDCPHVRSARMDSPVRSEVFNAKLNGHFIVTIYPFRTGKQSDPPWSIHVFHDISERRRMEDELLRSRNLESIGTLAGGIAHDFNNILTSLVGHIDLAKLHIGSSGKAIGHLDRSLRACHRAKELSNRLITFSEGGTPRTQAIGICHLIREVAELGLSGSNVACSLDLPDDLQPVVIDDVQIKAALQNIVTNAREAMPWGGTMTIKAGNAQQVTRDGRPANQGNFIRIDIIDQGVGIARSNLDKIFDPYFTTKQMGAQKGMGLGLAIAHSIIKKHKGHIDVQSVPGKGTTVSIFLPAAPVAQYMGHQNPLESPSRQAALRRVLFMDDEQMLWTVVAGMLERMGCTVDFAADAQQALDLFMRALEAGAPYGVVILDLTIRGGDGGKEVVRKMRAVDPGVRALAVSGYSSDPVFTDFKRFGFVGALNKPFLLEEFTAAVSQFIGVPEDKI